MKPIQTVLTILALIGAIELGSTGSALSNPAQVNVRQRLQVSSIPSNSSLFESGVKKQEQEDYTGAIADYTEFLKTHPDRVDAYSNRGFAKAMIEDLQGAIVDFDRAIELSPQLADAYNARGNVHAMAGNLSASIRDFNAAIRFDRSFADAYYNRGISRHSLGDRPGAKSDISKAAQLFRSQKDIGGYQQAREWIDKLR